MSRYNTRLPEAPVSWETTGFSSSTVSGKEWADSFTRTLEISLDTLGSSTENNAIEDSAKSTWFFS
tara:strand:- start:1328 stop:1525 length:198 start_codon:yes stop_codon:yes gene_type:complete